MKAKMHLNLLPPSFLQQIRLRRRLGVWIGLWIAAFLLCGGAAWKLRQQLHEKRAALATLQAEVRPLHQREAETRRLQAQSAAVRNRHSMVASFDVDQPPISLIGLISKTTANLGGQIIVDQLELKQIAAPAAAPNRPAPRAPRSAAPEPKPTAPAGKMDLTIQGVARDEVVVSQFVESLRASEMFLTVQLRSTRPQQSETGTARVYEVQCVY